MSLINKAANKARGRGLRNNKNEVGRQIVDQGQGSTEENEFARVMTSSPLLNFLREILSHISSLLQASTDRIHYSKRNAPVSLHYLPFVSLFAINRYFFKTTQSPPFATMRLFLIPISTRRALIYSRPLRKDIPKELSILDRVTTKAAQTWAKWEEADGGWKKSLVTWGNKVQQRIPFEEWGLKSIPSLNSQKRIDEAHGTKKIDVLYPGNSLRLEKIPTLLRTIATERQEFHRKKMRWSLGIAPLTAPLGLIPVYVAPELLSNCPTR